MMLIFWVIFIDKLKELYLIQALVKEILVIFYYFKAYINFCAKIMCPYNPAERRGAKILSDAIPSSYNRINDNRELFVFLKAGPAGDTYR